MTWQPVRGYAGLYSVSDEGHIRNERNGRLLIGASNGAYRQIYLAVGGKVERRFLHAIVAEAFIGPRPAGLQIDHMDGNTANNAASNLRYCSSIENVHANIARGTFARGSRNGVSKLTETQVVEIRALLRGEVNQRDVARRFGVSCRTISSIRLGETWRHVP